MENILSTIQTLKIVYDLLGINRPAWSVIVRVGSYTALQVLFILDINYKNRYCCVLRVGPCV